MAGRLVGPAHHRRAVRAVTGPRRALHDAGGCGRRRRHVDRHRVRCRAATVVLGGQEELRCPRRVGRLGRRRQDPAGGVEVPALQAGVVEERALQVVAARSRAEEPVAHQVAGADLELERLADPDGLGRVGDQQRRQLVLRGDLAHGGVHALCVRLLEAGVRRQLAGRAVPAEHVQAVVVAVPASGRYGAGGRGGGRGRGVGGDRCARLGGSCGLGRGRVDRSPRRPGPGSFRVTGRSAAAPAPVAVTAPLALAPPLPCGRRPGARRGLGVGSRRLGVDVAVWATGTTSCSCGSMFMPSCVAGVGRQVELGGTAVVTRGRRDHHGDRGRRDGDEAANAPGTGRGVELHRCLDRG